MNKYLVFVIAFLAVAIAITSIVLVLQDQNTANYEIAAIAYPYYLMAKDLGIKAELVIPPNQELHTYTPSIKDIEKVTSAKYIIMDGYLDQEFSKTIPRRKMIDPIPYRHGWLDLRAFINLSRQLKELGYNVNKSAVEQANKLLEQYQNTINVSAIALHKGLEDALKVYGINITKSLLVHEHETLSLNDIETLKNTDACIIIVTTPQQKTMLEEVSITNKPIVVLNLMNIKHSDNESYLAIMNQNLEALYNASRAC